MGAGPGCRTAPPAAARTALEAFLDSHDAWVIEGCYGELVEAAAPRCTELVFLNPGLQACLDNNRRRPWERHNYASRQAQDSMLPTLQAWVEGYYQRGDDWSYACHRRLFDAHAGAKAELTERPSLPPAEPGGGT